MVKIEGLEGERPWPAVETLVAMYNALTPDNVASVDTLSPGRRALASRALTTFPDLEWWLETFRQYHRSAFMLRRAKRQGFADLDWLLGADEKGVEHAVLVHDGRYRD